jgi:hypothetical protein
MLLRDVQIVNVTFAQRTAERKRKSRLHRATVIIRIQQCCGEIDKVVHSSSPRRRSLKTDLRILPHSTEAAVLLLLMEIAYRQNSSIIHSITGSSRVERLSRLNARLKASEPLKARARPHDYFTGRTSQTLMWRRHAERGANLLHVQEVCLALLQGRHHCVGFDRSNDPKTISSDEAHFYKRMRSAALGFYDLFPAFISCQYSTVIRLPL